MSTHEEQNEATVRELFANASQGNFGALDEILGPDYLLHPQEISGVDGLTEMVGNQVIGEILGSHEAAQPICQRLVERALEAGGKDNVTVVVARYRLP